MSVRFLKRRDFLDNMLIETFDLETDGYYIDDRAKNKVIALLESAKATIISIEEARDLVDSGATPLGEETIRLLNEKE